MEIKKNTPPPVTPPPPTYDVTGLSHKEALALAYHLGKNGKYDELSTYNVFSKLVSALGKEYHEFRAKHDKAAQNVTLPAGWTFKL